MVGILRTWRNFGGQFSWFDMLKQLDPAIEFCENTGRLKALTILKTFSNASAAVTATRIVLSDASKLFRVGKCNNMVVRLNKSKLARIHEAQGTMSRREKFPIGLTMVPLPFITKDAYLR